MVNYPKCSKELPANIKFCTDCGAKMEQANVLDPIRELICPNCSNTLPADKRFCTECGTKITQSKALPLKKPQNIGVNDEIVDNIKETGKEMVKEVEGFFNKATSKGGMLDKLSKSLDNAAPQNKDYSKGYLYCSDCGGYYKLQTGESPDDFDNCQCGGELKYVIAIPKWS